VLRRFFLRSVMATAVVAAPFAPVDEAGAMGAGAASIAQLAGLTALSVTPHRGLVDGEKVTVRVSSGSYGTTYAVVECDPKALLLLLQPSASVQDACDSGHNAVMTVGAAGVATTAFQVPALLTTALGGADCRKVRCFIAVEAIHSTGGLGTLVQDLSFAATACAAPGSCLVPADAWDPSLGAAPSAHPAPTAGHTAPGGGAGPPGPEGTPGSPLVVAVQPTVAGDLTAPGSVTGPFTGSLWPSPAPPGTPLTTVPSTPPATTVVPVTTSSPVTPGTTVPPVTPAAGEGLLRLALEAPGTSWGPGVPSSAVVDATVTDLTTHEVGPAQQFVLFWGASPFVYAGFAGPVRSTDRYSLTLSVEPDASRGDLSQPPGGLPPEVVLLADALEVVAPSNPQYLAYAYAPVMYGRSTSALHDVPLLAYAGVKPGAGGADAVSYVIVWSHEDAGTGFLPFLEWGTWGRMTDIENAISFTVAPNGSVSGAQYLWGGEPAVGFPDSQSALKEIDKPFTGTWWGHHPVLRDATGNNDFSDKGTTGFRFQLAPVAAPPAGAARDAVMDTNPFTYQVMADEIARWYGDTSTDPGSPEPGVATQYAIVDLDTSGRGVSSVAVYLRLSGYTGWFRSDFGWGYPLVGSGHVRTVVKLPVGWASSTLTSVQVVVEPPSAALGVTIRSLMIERFTGTAVVQVPAPSPVVAPESLSVASTS